MRRRELALCLIAMRHGYLPEIRNLTVPCREGINFVRKGTGAAPRTIMVENFGFGGQNSALILEIPHV
jgi:3-oxoacyl-[acyl-carrier-protein] synthase II